MSKIVFALHASGRVRHVSDVLGGLACRCTCLDCRQPLVARKGLVREHHFGHYCGTEHDWAWETHLHAYAKQLIAEAGGLSAPLHPIVAEHLGLPVSATVADLKAGEIPIQREVGLGSVRPDLVLHLPARDIDIALEVRVTHACERSKLDEFKRKRLPALEIDLSQFPHQSFDLEKLRFAVLRATKNKKWLWPAAPVAERTSSHGHRIAPLPPKEPRPEPHGPSLPLPAPATLQFLVRPWSAVVTVSLEHTGEG